MQSDVVSIIEAFSHFTPTGFGTSFMLDFYKHSTHNPDEPEPNRKKLLVSGFYESPGSKIYWLESGRFGKSEYH
jgi:hypothetical protein